LTVQEERRNTAVNSPRVSVVMSVYNGMPYLDAAIQSILGQTFNDFEFIILEDGSTDDTWAALEQYALQDARIHLVRNPQNLGYTRSLNEGFKRARGEFIARQDADDISLPTRLESQVAFLDSHPEVGLVGTRRRFIDPQGATLEIPDRLVALDNSSIQEALLDFNCIHHGSFMFRCKLLEQVGLYAVELEPAEDYDFCLRVAEVAQLANLPEQLYLYRVHPSSVSHLREYRQAYNKALALERAIFRRFGEHPPTQAFANVGRDYLRAAVVAFLANQPEDARACLQQAQSLYPLLFRRDEPLASTLRGYLLQEHLEERLEFLNAIFIDLLPSTQRLRRLRSRLLSEQHMSEVFKIGASGCSRAVKSHLNLGLRYDPSWLFNRGVVVLLLKQTVSSWKKVHGE